MRQVAGGAPGAEGWQAARVSNQLQLAHSVGEARRKTWCGTHSSLCPSPTQVTQVTEAPKPAAAQLLHALPEEAMRPLSHCGAPLPPEVNTVANS